MSDHIDTRDGWRPWVPGTVLKPPYVKFVTAGAADVIWVREEPVPPLPTENMSVIFAKWPKGESADIIKTPDGWKFIEGLVVPEDSLKSITGFEVLSEPRAVTAKAVLDRVMITGISGAVVDDLFRDFGVTE